MNKQSGPTGQVGGPQLVRAQSLVEDCGDRPRKIQNAPPINMLEEMGLPWQSFMCVCVF